MTSQTKRAARPRGRRLIGAAALLGCAASAAATLWESPHWALTAAAEAGVGYDSNLFARAGSASDGYLAFTPTLSLRRLDSLTNLHGDLSVRSYSFLDRTDLNSLDPTLTVNLRYPSDAELFATQEFEARVSRRTDANYDVGGRLRHDDFGVRWEGGYALTGKLNLLPRFSYGRTNYLTPGYNDSEAASAGATLGLVKNERLQLGAGYDFESSRSLPDSPLRRGTTGRRHSFTLRGRGEFLPKVTGYAFVGVSHGDYRGDVERDDWDFVASMSLAWQATERGALTWRANRLSYFSADGSVTTVSDVNLEWTQQLAGGFFASLGAGAGHAEYHSTSRPRSDDRYGGTFELRYALTERFGAGVKATWSNQSSDDPLDDYDHSTVYANVTYKF